MNRRYHLWIAFGLLFITIGVIQHLSGTGSDATTGMFVTTGAVVLVFAGTRAMRKDEGPEQDERTRRIGAYGITYSWFVTLLYLFVLFWVQNLGVIALSSSDVILSSILLMAISARLFQWWFFRRGDVE
ncbi:hypothetical protein [Methanofollis fontis]|uniref:DUF2178 domain-containing protein n=1 Tax=Methanofollis fontis TaxID=2052832 RepID=A0A483CVJ0_9EURY|nr:hypothetical protein [Methanofollis fontis]TAJ45676.1 hypothetical protein CUJ86_02880 [Methanofollis fontis]